MVERINNKMRKVAIETMSKMNSLLKEERGASELVVVVAMIVIVLVVASVFRGQLERIIIAMGNKVVNWIGN